MYELENVALIDWFLLGRQDIAVRGSVGVYGENRSGKSTLLDAIQVAMLSNDKHALQLNAAANQEKKKKNRRSVHGYSLGRLGGANEPPLRDVARSHLALAYRDSVSGAFLSSGLVLEASVAHTREDTVARWIAVGIRVDTDDLVIRTLDGDIARTWPELEDHLAARCAAEGGELRIHMTAADHMGDVLHLASQSGRHGGVDQFRRAFANAVSFETIEDESHFVRTYVLDRDNISIRGLRESMRNYREIAETIRSLLKQVEDLDNIIAAARQYGSLIEEKAHRSWMRRRANVLVALREVRKHRRALDKASAAAARHKRVIEDCDRQMQELRSERQNLQQALLSSDVAAQLAGLQIDAEVRKRELEKLAKPVQEWEAAVNRAVSVLDQDGAALELVRELSPALLPALAEMRELAVAGATAWPADPDALAVAIDRLPNLDALGRAIGDHADQRLKELDQQEAVQLRARIEAIDTSGAAIRPQTRAFQLELENQGLRPKLVCAEIEVTKPEWRDAAEAVLARDREAIVLPPEQAQKAAAILRADRHVGRFRGCRVVNTSHLVAPKAQAGTLSSVLRARDPLVAAFVGQRVGNVRLVDTEAELHAGGRAVTKDCAYCDGLVTEIRHVDERKIGADASGTTRRELEARLRALEAEQAAIAHLVRGLRAVADRLAPLAAARGQEAGLVDVVLEFRDKQRQLEAVREQGRRLRDQVQPEITARLDEIESDLAALELELNGDPDGADADSRKGAKALWEAAIGEQASARSHLNACQPDLTVALDLYRKEKAQVLFAQALPLWGTERARHRGALPPLVRACEQRMAELADILPRAKQDVLNQVFEFRRTSRRNLSFDNQASISEVILPWASHLRDDIARKDLAQHRRRADEAVDEAQKLLKGNFINMLRDRFERVHGAIEMLNSVLRQHAFHNERYRFDVDPDAEFAGLINLVTAAALDETVLLPLFGGAEMEASFHAESLKMIEAILMEDDLDCSRYEDYRNYFRFNLVMTDVETGKQTTFAHRLGVGSGAEKQVPFYVAIGAALASAYHNGAFDKDKPGGLGLALFDEAFMKMDPKNQAEVLHFYREIGLQPVLAGPKGGKLFMQKNMDTLVKVARPSYRRMIITVTHPGPALREALAAHDPGEWPREKLEAAYAAHHFGVAEQDAIIG